MKFYRYKNPPYISQYSKSIIEVTFTLIKETPCGYWIVKDYKGALFNIDENKRWVSKNGLRRWAYPTKLEAMVNFWHRKRKEIELLEYRLKRSIKAQKEVDKMIKAVIMEEKANEAESDIQYSECGNAG